MLNATDFKKRLQIGDHSGWLRLAVNARNDEQFFIIGYAGMGNTISMPIENYLPEIKDCVLNMLQNNELIKEITAHYLFDRGIDVFYFEYQIPVDNS